LFLLTDQKYQSRKPWPLGAIGKRVSAYKIEAFVKVSILLKIQLVKNATTIIALFTALLIITVDSAAQNAEAEIRNLENIEHKAMKEQDTATLSNILAPDIIVTTPTNKIIVGRKNVYAMKKATAQFLSFEREVEQVVIKEDIAISMGNETVVTSENSGTQKISKRRYTNVWIKQNGKWTLIARQTSEICKP
jgi:uncharacterized protein (TIGR02246 family)